MKGLKKVLTHNLDIAGDQNCNELATYLKTELAPYTSIVETLPLGGVVDGGHNSGTCCYKWDFPGSPGLSLKFSYSFSSCGIIDIPTKYSRKTSSITHLEENDVPEGLLKLLTQNGFRGKILDKAKHEFGWSEYSD